MVENPGYSQEPVDQIPYAVPALYMNAGPAIGKVNGFPFTRTSPLRRYTEPATFLHYPLVAAYTVMDDEIAAAVDKHSTYKQHPWGRLSRVIDAAIMLVFGDADESLAVAKRLHSYHNIVQGSHEGITYGANDTRLQEWVLASVFKVGIEATNNRWAEPLPDSVRQGVYVDVKTFGQWFGAKQMPADVEALDCYWEERKASLLRTDVSRRVATEVIRFTNAKVPRFISRTAQAVSITSLEEPLQAKADLWPSADDVRIAQVVDGVMRNTYGRTPHKVREQVIPVYLGGRRAVSAIGRLGKLSVA